MNRAVLCLLITMLVPSYAHAQKRVALVIGNSAYQHAGTLANPKNDAIDVSAALKSLGFHVIDGFDLDKTAFDRKVRDFASALQGAEAGLFFFAGHGLQVAGQNYLVPVDAELTTTAALDFEMVRVDAIQRVMEHQTSTNLLFLDACRNNPLARNLARAMGTRSTWIGPGLAATEAGVGTLISFSTQPGNVAVDGTGRNSPFAGALAKHISTPNSDLGAILIRVRNDVIKDTQRQQVPWEHSALTGQFYFVPQSFPSPTISLRPPAVSELFTDEQRKRVDALSRSAQLPIPKFQINKPVNVDESTRRFVGVWAGNFEDSGRHVMLIVENVSSGGQAMGYRVIGPQMAKSTVGTPAAHYPFVGAISGDKLTIKGNVTQTVVHFRTPLGLDLVETWTHGMITKASLAPVWTLVEAERAIKR